jgi:hypothetical protein
METDTPNQEVLLNINTSFFKREYCEREEKNDIKKLSQRELLKTLCWDGFLPELLPEICARVNNKPVILWELLETQHLLHLRFGGYQEKLDRAFSLNPYLLLDVMPLN